MFWEDLISVPKAHRQTHTFYFVLFSSFISATLFQQGIKMADKEKETDNSEIHELEVDKKDKYNKAVNKGKEINMESGVKSARELHSVKCYPFAFKLFLQPSQGENHDKLCNLQYS